MANKKIRRISCGCKGKEASGGMKDKTHIGRNCHCNIDTPKGKRYKGITTVDIHKVKSIVEYLSAYKR